MARVNHNNFTRGISGKIGHDMLFRSWNGKTYLSKMPKKPTQESARQKANRINFKMAAHHAKTLIQDPIMKAKYLLIAKAQKLPNAYTAALTEYMRKKNPAGSQQETVVSNADRKWMNYPVSIVEDIREKAISPALSTIPLYGLLPGHSLKDIVMSDREKFPQPIRLWKLHN